MRLGCWATSTVVFGLLKRLCMRDLMPILRLSLSAIYFEILGNDGACLELKV